MNGYYHVQNITDQSSSRMPVRDFVDVLMNSSEPYILKTIALITGNHLHTSTDDATDRGMPYRLGLYDDVDTALDAGLLDPRHAILLFQVTLPDCFPMQLGANASRLL